MLSYILSRLVALALSLVVASLVIFVMIELVPGDPASFMLGLNAAPDTVAALRAELGLGGSPVERYLRWVGGMLQGDFGTSYTYRAPVAELVTARLAVSLPLFSRRKLVWIDVGAGTARNLEFFPVETLRRRFEKIYILDISASLLEVARQRVEKAGLSDIVELVLADFTDLSAAGKAALPPAGSADLVTFSYSLSMIPDKAAALRQAARLINDTGAVGVADFFQQGLATPNEVCVFVFVCVCLCLCVCVYVWSCCTANSSPHAPQSTHHRFVTTQRPPLPIDLTTILCAAQARVEAVFQGL